MVLVFSESFGNIVITVIFTIDFSFVLKTFNIHTISILSSSLKIVQGQEEYYTSNFDCCSCWNKRSGMGALALQIRWGYKCAFLLKSEISSKPVRVTAIFFLQVQKYWQSACYIAFFCSFHSVEMGTRGGKPIWRYSSLNNCFKQL